MNFGHADTSGQFVLFSAFQMESAVGAQGREHEAFEWEKHFWSVAFQFRGDSPMPIMVNNKPYWRGVYPPANERETEAGDRVYVASFDLKIYRVAPRAVRLPTDEEYDKYFKKYVEAGSFILQKIRPNSDGLVMRRRGGWRAMQSLISKKQ